MISTPSRHDGEAVGGDGGTRSARLRIESGSSVKREPRLSKAGNRFLRIALTMRALSASRFDGNVRAYYQHLIEHRGLKKIQAICAVMRKLLHAIHAMLKSRTIFDSSRFYTATAVAA